MNEIQNMSRFGNIKIADEVIATIAGTAALEAEGVYGMPGNFTNGISVIPGRKNLSKGVKIEVLGNDVIIDINILVKFGYKIDELSVLVQKKVKTAIETMTGLTVSNINVNISGIHQEKQNHTELTDDDLL